MSPRHTHYIKRRRHYRAFICFTCASLFYCLSLINPFIYFTQFCCSFYVTVQCRMLIFSKLWIAHFVNFHQTTDSDNRIRTNFLHERLKWTLVDQPPFTSETEWLCVDVDGYKIVNVYKPPPTPLQTTDLPVFPHPVLYSGDFNCPHVNWGYSSNSADGECLVAWASLNGLVPLHDPKDMATFHLGRWNTGTNSDLVFVSVGPDSRLPDRRILEKFPRSQH